MVIVAIVVVLLFKMGESNAHHPSGRRSHTQQTTISIATASDQFYTEYNCVPDVPVRVTTDSADGIRLMNILAGLIRTDAPSGNPRGFKFLSIKEGKGKQDGVIYDSDGKFIVGVFDEWGNPFTIFLDTDYNEILHLKEGSREVTLKGRRAAVVSPGEDGKLGTGDDIKTW